MNTALDKLKSAIADDVSGGRNLLSFAFSYDGYEMEYMGRYYAYVHPVGDSRARVSDEYCWNGYDEMLAAQIAQFRKSMAEVLSEIPDHDLEMEFDIPLPPGAVRSNL